MGRLDQKVAIVTGAGQGVGRGIALAMAKEGARIVVAGRNTTTCPAVVAELRALGASAVFAPCDVTHKPDVGKTIKAAVEAFGTVDIVVNNAHSTRKVYAPFLEWTDDALQEQMNSSYMASVWFMQQSFPYLKVRGGSIINIASGVGHLGAAGYLGYAACKEAQRVATRVAAREWGQFKIRANTICPIADSPPIQTISERPEEGFGELLKQIALGRVGSCEHEIGRTAVFLASPDGAYITGHTIHVDGGYVMDSGH